MTALPGDKRTSGGEGHEILAHKQPVPCPMTVLVIPGHGLARFHVTIRPPVQRSGACGAAWTPESGNTTPEVQSPVS
jgi:hypothetical protein